MRPLPLSSPSQQDMNSENRAAVLIWKQNKLLLASDPAVLCVARGWRDSLDGGLDWTSHPQPECGNVGGELGIPEHGENEAGPEAVWW